MSDTKGVLQKLVESLKTLLLKSTKMKLNFLNCNVYRTEVLFKNSKSSSVEAQELKLQYLNKKHQKPARIVYDDQKNKRIFIGCFCKFRDHFYCSHTTNGNFFCENCPKFFKTRSKMIVHVRNHTDEFQHKLKFGEQWLPIFQEEANESQLQADKLGFYRIIPLVII